MRIVHTYPWLLTPILLLVLLFGCAPSNQFRIKERAGARGFTKEYDEPSARGVLKKLQLGDSDVSLRFCITPDFKNIVYSARPGSRTATSGSGAGRAYELWRVAVDGGSPVKITAGSDEDARYPTFTADGQEIVYESQGLLWKIRSDGAGGRMRLPGSGLEFDTEPQLSSKNQLVFCSLQRSGYELKSIIWTSHLDGGELTQLREGQNPQWSPSGDKITFSFDGDIWTVDARGTGLTQLTNTPKIVEGLPAFSPDGAFISYVSNEGKNGRGHPFDVNIWVMKSDGSEKSQITELESWDSWPCWSDKELYFLSARGSDSRGKKLQRIWSIGIAR